MFRLILEATLFTHVPMSPTQKEVWNLWNSPPRRPLPWLWCRPSHPPPDPPTNSSLQALFLLSLPMTRGGGDRLRGGDCGQDHEGSGCSRFSRWPTLRALGPAYLGMQALRLVGEDACSLPAASGKVQDGSSCRYVGVFAALTVAIRAGTARALCVGAGAGQPIGKFPWIGKMLCC